jgi:hypothetical protein
MKKNILISINCLLFIFSLITNNTVELNKKINIDNEIKKDLKKDNYNKKKIINSSTITKQLRYKEKLKKYFKWGSISLIIISLGLIAYKNNKKNKKNKIIYSVLSKESKSKNYNNKILFLKKIIYKNVNKYFPSGLLQNINQNIKYLFSAIDNLTKHELGHLITYILLNQYKNNRIYSNYELFFEQYNNLFITAHVKPNLHLNRRYINKDSSLINIGLAVAYIAGIIFDHVFQKSFGIDTYDQESIFYNTSIDTHREGDIFIFIKQCNHIKALLKKNTQLSNKNKISFKKITTSLIENFLKLLQKNQSIINEYLEFTIKELSHFTINNSKQEIFDLTKIDSVKTSLFDKVWYKKEKENLYGITFDIGSKFVNNIPHLQTLVHEYKIMMKKILQEVLFLSEK